MLQKCSDKSLGGIWSQLRRLTGGVYFGYVEDSRFGGRDRVEECFNRTHKHTFLRSTGRVLGEKDKYVADVDLGAVLGIDKEIAVFVGGRHEGVEMERPCARQVGQTMKQTIPQRSHASQCHRCESS